MDPATAYLLSGLIMMFVIGGAIGNYATSVVYRLPLCQTPFEKKPYCGDCGFMLGAKDLMPVFSYLISGGKCRNCGVRIRPSYFIVELASIAVCMLGFLQFGLAEDFFLVGAIGIFLIIHCALIYHEQRYFSLIITYILALGAIHRVWQDHVIFPMVQSAFIMLVLAGLCWQIGRLFKLANNTCPPFVWWMGVVGVILPLPQALCVFTIAIVKLFPVLTTSHKQLLFAVLSSMYIYAELLGMNI